MIFLQLFFEFIFILSQIIVAIFSLHYVFIFYKNLRLLKSNRPFKFSEKELTFPNVTFQVPIYNEKHVIKNFIHQIAQINYPIDKFEIQLLDDSTDETYYIIEEEIKKYSHINFKHIHRTNRSNFKSGALNNGLLSAQGEYIAIFDVDFSPPRDFLQKTIPELEQNQKLAFIQTRWGHRNRESLLTKSIALSLDNHFLIEQPVRKHIGVMNFNGTCGVFRKNAIIDAGYWDGSILAEDLDLSYRLYMKGWSAEYNEDIICEGEIPNKISSFMQQQYRWAKGTIQGTKKNISSIIKSQKLNKSQKLEAIFHHFGYFIQMFIFLNIISTIPLLYYRSSLFDTNFGLIVFFVNLLASSMYFSTIAKLHLSFVSSIKYIFLLTALTIGISWKTTIATFDGLLHKSGTFTRTPKGISSNKHIYLNKSRLDFLIELILILFICEGIYLAVITEKFVAIFYLAFCLFGLGYVFILTLQELLNINLEDNRITELIKSVLNVLN